MNNSISFLSATEVASPRKKRLGITTLVADKKNETHATKVAFPVGGI